MMHSDAPAGRELQKRTGHTLKIISAVNHSIAEKVLPFYLSLKGLLWSPNIDDQEDLGTFDIGRDAFQALGMLRRSKFFRNLLAGISDAHRADRPTRLLKLVCHLDSVAFADLAHADAVMLDRIEHLATFLRSLPSSHHIFERITIFVPERPLVVLQFWRRILPLCHSQIIAIHSYASPSVHGDTFAASVFPRIHLPRVKRLYIGHLAFSQLHWSDALHSIYCPSLEVASISTNAPIGAVARFLSNHLQIYSIRSIRYLPGTTSVDATTFQSISLPALRSVHGCQDRVAPLLTAINSKATIESVHLDAAHGKYGTWIEGVLRCIPNQDLQSLSIAYVGPVEDGEVESAGIGSATSRLSSEILPRRLRRYEQSQLDYMSIYLRNLSKLDAKVSDDFFASRRRR